MASIFLAAAGTAIAGRWAAGLGVSAAVIGGAVGSIASAAIDFWLIESMAPTQRIASQAAVSPGPNRRARVRARFY